MNTAMSTKRSFVSNRYEPSKSTSSTGNLPLFALIGGFAVMFVGIWLNQAWMAAIGFVSFISAGIYYNSMFWADMYGAGRLKDPTHQTWVNRHR